MKNPVPGLKIFWKVMFVENKTVLFSIIQEFNALDY